MLTLSRVRIATATQLAAVVTNNGLGVGYALRGLRDLRALGLVGHGQHGREKVWHLTAAGQWAVAEGGDVAVRPHAATGERAIAAGLAPHGLAVTDVIVRWGGPILDWEVEVDHTIDKARRVVADAVLYRPGRGAEAEFLELDRFTMSPSRLALKLRAYEAYSKATVFEGERGTIGSTKPLWRQRYPDSAIFPVVRLVLGGSTDADALDRRATALQRRIHGIALRVDVAVLPRLLGRPSAKWTWRPIGQSEEEAQVRFGTGSADPCLFRFGTRPSFRIGTEAATSARAAPAATSDLPGKGLEHCRDQRVRPDSLRRRPPAAGLCRSAVAGRSRSVADREGAAG
ncbi:replication-relaxation family protein [Streptomyces termitum]|uniref:replication-relaxation family protein n=1 Tax=Streptomyces termitum TaxID=67368 RepID=UPI0033BDAAE8